MNIIEVDVLQKKLGYRFKRMDLLLQALTHRSFAAQHNERLEFLGDAILNYVIADFLYRKYNHINEGEMSRMRSNLVCSKTLMELAKEFNLGIYVKLGQGELKNAGYKRESILANTVEALIGGIFLDSNIQITEILVRSWYEIRFNQICLENKQKDPKTQLQEYLQHYRLPLPIYCVNQIIGKAHEQLFVVSCQVVGKLEAPIIGHGSSRRKAEQDAAKIVLRILKKHKHVYCK